MAHKKSKAKLEKQNKATPNSVRKISAEDMPAYLHFRRRGGRVENGKAYDRKRWRGVTEND